VVIILLLFARRRVRQPGAGVRIDYGGAISKRKFRTLPRAGADAGAGGIWLSEIGKAEKV